MPTQKTSPEPITHFSYLLHEKVREVESTTDVDFLIAVSSDHEILVRSAVARHPLTPQVVLRKMCRDSSMGVRQAVASNRSTPPDVLDLLARSRNLYVRLLVSDHLATTAHSLLRLSVDGDERVRAVAEPRLSTCPRPDLATALDLSLDEVGYLLEAPSSQRRSILESLLLP